MLRFTYTLSLAIVSTLAILFAPSVTAFEYSIQDGALAARGEDQPIDLFGTTGIFSTLTNALLFLIGAIAVIMLIIGGLKYVVSGGDQARVTAAKNTILYAIIGIIVALLAYAIVSFVTNSFVEGGSGGLDV